MNMKEEVLLQTAKEYYATAQEAYEKKRANSAVILYFKTLVALSDIYVLRKTGETPSSHTTRFGITKKQFPEIYRLLDKDFPYYQDSYVQLLELELAAAIRDDVNVMEEKLGIKL